MTTVSDAFPSNYLKAADLNNRTNKLKMDKVIPKQIHHGGRAVRVWPAEYSRK